MARRCTATTKRTGKPCPNYEGFFGLAFDAEGRCACHTTDAGLHAAYQAKRAEGQVRRASLNSAPKAPKTLEDAAVLAAWAARQVAKGKLGLEEAKALMGLLKEFRELLGARDADTKLAEARRVLEEMKALRATRA